MSSALLGQTSALTSSTNTSNAPADPFALSDSKIYVAAETSPGNPIFMHETGDFSKPCSFSVSGPHNMFCTLEAGEGLLHESGVKLKFNFPAGSCSSVKIMPYFYYRFEPGIGPSEVILNDSSGTLTFESASGGNFDPAKAAIDKDYVKIKDGAFVCPFDHSKENSDFGAGAAGVLSGQG